MSTPAFLTPTLALVAAAALIGGGCKSTATIERMRQEAEYDVQNKEYVKAIPKYNDLYDCVLAGEPASEGAKAAEETSISPKNELLWRMERGTIETIRGDVKMANAHLLRASKLVDDRRTVSVSRSIATGVANDNASEYAGKGYEHTQVDYHNAVSHLLMAERKMGELVMPALAAEANAAATVPGKDGTTLIANKGAKVDASDATDASKPLDYLWSRAHSLSRRMVIDNIKHNKDDNAANRYYDDPYARFFAAALVMATPPDLKTGGDDSFAYDQMRRAAVVYRDQYGTFASDPKFRYEVNKVPDLVVRLGINLGKRFDPEGIKDLLQKYDVKADDFRLAKAELPAGQGMVLVLNHADYITPTNALQIDLKVNVPWVPTVSEAEKQRGVTITPFRAWTTTFYAKGPGSNVAENWGGAVAATAEILSLFGKMTPGTWIGFEIPAHRPDVPIKTPGLMLVDGKETEKLEVLSDLDAYARATLRDEQPGVLTKTLIRVATKHIAAEVAQKSMEAAAGNDQTQQLVAKLLGCSSHAAASASESADTRHWTLLYDHIEGALAYMPKGQHQIAITTAAGKTELGTVDVPEGRLVIVTTRTFPNPMPNPYPSIGK